MLRLWKTVAIVDLQLKNIVDKLFERCMKTDAVTPLTDVLIRKGIFKTNAQPFESFSYTHS